MLKTEKNTLSYCGLCERIMVLCGVCGNNTCNGGYGEVNGVDCPNCPSAYEEDKNRDAHTYINTVEILQHQKDRLEGKIARQAEQITRLETSRRELRRINRELLEFNKIEEQE